MNNVFTLNPQLISFKLLLFLEVLLTAGLLIFYVFQVNSGAAERYLIQEYQKRLNELSRENQGLEVSSAQTNSLDNVTALLDGLNFEKIDKINYIQVLSAQVVAK